MSGDFSAPSAPVPLMDILDAARFVPAAAAPAWRFRILDSNRVRIVVSLGGGSLFDRGHFATALAAGLLLETLRIAATGHGCVAIITTGEVRPDEVLAFDARFISQSYQTPDALYPCLTASRPSRKAFRTRALAAEEKAELEKAAGEAFECIWHDGARRRDAVAILRAVEQRCLEVPELTRSRYGGAAAKAMASLLARSHFGYRLACTAPGHGVLSLLGFDFSPGLCAGAHLSLAARTPPRHLLDYVRAGEALRRLTLTATQLGLAFDPSLTLLALLRSKNTDYLHSLYADLLGSSDLPDRVVWFGRIGERRSRDKAAPWSPRRALQDLIEPADAGAGESRRAPDALGQTGPVMIG